MRLSIVIPVYNVEEYVEACIISCLNQNIPHDTYEIIVVNDGSTDTSLDIVSKLAKNYDNIKVFDYPNGGLSVARNIGLSHASGEYVWFVDSDDRIEENCLLTLLQEAEGNEVVAFAYKEYRNGIEVDDYQYHKHGDTMTGLQFIVQANNTFMHGVPFYLFRRDFLIEHNMTFYPGIYHEDTEFTPKMLSFVKRLFVSGGRYYYRTLRAGSITNTYNSKRAYDILFVVGRLHEHILSLSLTKNEKNSMLMLLPMLVNNSLNSMTLNSKEEIQRYNEYFTEHRLFKYFFVVNNFRYRLEGLMLYLFRHRAVQFYKLIKR